MFANESRSPNAFKSQMMTRITTRIFSIDFIFLSMGMKEFTSQSNTPTTIRTSRIVTSDIIYGF
jgi:hypothetical protein